jgi:multisubunit Na+/H+ antiporter MnhG subunit
MSDNHGNTIAAWSAVGIAILAFVISGIGLMVYSWPTFWVGAVILVIAPVVGVILAKMGYGATH